MLIRSALVFTLNCASSSTIFCANSTSFEANSKYFLVFSALSDSFKAIVNAVCFFSVTSLSVTAPEPDVVSVTTAESAGTAGDTEEYSYFAKLAEQE